MIQAIIPDLVVGLCALHEFATGDLTGDMHLADLRTMAGGGQYARPGSPVEARQEEVAREYLQRAEELDRKLDTP